MAATEPTAFPDLNRFLAAWVDEIVAILGSDLIGAYLVGSFALHDGDMSSDCDFLAVTRDGLQETQVEALRALHAAIPNRSGYWAINFEGSYPPEEDLTTLDRLGRPWLYVNRGGRDMEWSDHCNVVDTRWVLHERGIPLVGPPAATFACAVPEDMLRDRMRELIPGFLSDLETWASFDLVWTQRYMVETMCRMLYTLHTGGVESKRRSLEWARAALPSGWRSLIDRALVDRSLPWDDPADPTLVDRSREFVAFATERAGTG